MPETIYSTRILPRISRRSLLAGSCAAGALLLSGCSRDSSSKQTAGCVDPDSLPDSERSLRASMAYTDAAANPEQACGGCAFFHAAETAPGCGRCDIVLGTVDAKGHCQSWSRRG